MLKEVRWSLKNRGVLFFLLLVLATMLAGASLAQAAATAPKVMTNHWKSGSSEGYQLNFEVADTATVLISDATVSGPGVASAALTRPSDTSSTLTLTVNISSRPSVGDIYTFTVNYVDTVAAANASETDAVPVNAVLDSFATTGAPSGPITSGANPTFAWTAPAADPGTSYSYRVYMEGADGAWESGLVDSTLTSYKYASTVFSPNVAPTGGILYDWSISVVDANGNSSENWSSPFMLWTNFTGKVTDLAGNGIGNVSVRVYDSLHNVQILTGTTQADGSYFYGGLNAGNYLVAFSNGTTPVYYKNKLLTEQADLVTVTTGTLTTGVDSVIGNWGLISGKAVNSAGTGIAGVGVSVYDTHGNAIASVPGATTKSDGTFLISPVPAGTYTVKFSGGGAGYQDGWYANQSPVFVYAGQTADLVVDTVLYKAVLTGKVTDASGSAIPGVFVWLYSDRNGTWANNLDGSYFSGVQTQADGSYAIGGIASGTYYLYFEGATGLANQYYRAKGTLAQADGVTVSSISTTTGINAVMSTGVPTVTGFTIPATSATRTLTGIVFTATEPNGVGYLLNESSTPPSASATGWSATAPTSYTFTSGGSKTLYGWVKGYSGTVVAAGSQDVAVSDVPAKYGDCDNSGSVSIAEVQSSINMFLGMSPVASCVDQDNSGSVTIADVQKVINAFLGI